MSRLGFFLAFQCSVSEEAPPPPPDDIQLLVQSSLNWLLNLPSIAKDRFWFGDDYTPWPSVLTNGLRVEGIGSVTLPTKRTPKSTGSGNHGSLHLSEVLHVPEAACNFLGAPLVHSYVLKIDWANPSSCSIRDKKTGQQLACFRYASDGKQFALRLSGPPVGPQVGPASVSVSGVYDIQAAWPDAEQFRWIAHKNMLNIQATAVGDIAPISNTNPLQVVAQEQDLSEMFARIVSLGEHETRNYFMFPQLHDAVLSAVDGAIPSLRFNSEDTEDGLDEEYDTCVMGSFVCTNRECKKSGWNSKKVAIWIRGYGHGGPCPSGYNAVVFNQRCVSCDCLGTFTIDEQSYIERVSYRLRKWAGVAVTPPIYNLESRGPHVEELCEGCRNGHCSL